MTRFTIRSMLAATLASALPALAANVLHVGPRESLAAWQFDWRGSAATVVNGVGRAEASVVAIGPRRLATLATPLSQTFVQYDPDCPELEVQVRSDVLQLAVTRLSGTEARGNSAVVEIGTFTTLNGCNAGRVEPFGSPGDPGVATQHLAAVLRPSLADLAPGVALAGPSDQPGLDSLAAVDVTSFGPGTLSFATTGGVYATSTVDGWLVLSLPFGERGYTRLAVDRAGAETWVAADWSAGVPQRVFRTLMVKPAAGAGFGTRREAARIWVPLRNSGTTHFVMESEQITLPDGTVQPFIAPRINFYIDEGAATPPSPAAARPAARSAPAPARQPINRPRT